MNRNRQEKGITLIALVVTIIVLLILAGISIAMLTGENGILKRTAEAKDETKRQDIIEKAKLEILEYETEKEKNITDEEALEIISKYDKDYNAENEFTYKEKDDEKYITTKEGYDILVREIWNYNTEKNRYYFTINGISCYFDDSDASFTESDGYGCSCHLLTWMESHITRMYL